MNFQRGQYSDRGERRERVRHTFGRGARRGRNCGCGREGAEGSSSGDTLQRSVPNSRRTGKFAAFNKSSIAIDIHVSIFFFFFLFFLIELAKSGLHDSDDRRIGARLRYTQL